MHPRPMAETSSVPRVLVSTVVPPSVGGDRLTCAGAAGVPCFAVASDSRQDARPDAVRSWYGEHFAPALQPEAVYGLTEHYREEIRNAPIIACPG